MLVGSRLRISSLVGLLEALEDVGGVVRVELGDGPGQEFVRQRFHELVANCLVELREDLGVESRPQRLDQGDALIGLEEADDIGEIGRAQRRGKADGAVGVPATERLRHLARELGGVDGILICRRVLFTFDHCRHNLCEAAEPSKEEAELSI